MLRHVKALLGGGRRRQWPRVFRVHAEHQAGFTLIETVVGAMLVTLISGAVAASLISSNHLSSDQRFHSQADQLAQQDQERLRGLSAEDLNNVNGQSRTVQVDGTQFTVTSTTQFLNSSGGTACGSSGNGAAAYFRTASRVNWPSNTRPAVVEEGVISPPAGGVLLTQVEDQTNSGLPGVGVTASGPDSASGTTDSQGCVVLAGLTPGAYTLSLSASGYVDKDGNLSPLTSSSTVSGSGTATPNGGNPVRMGIPGAITAQFTTTNNNVTYPNQLADAVSWFGNGPSYGMSAPKSFGSGPPALQFSDPSMQHLFPFAYPGYTNNYQVWAGKCQQMEPPAGTTGTMFSVAPGSSQTAQIAEPAINLTATYNGAAVTPSHVKFTFASTPGSGPTCNDSWFATVVPNTGMGNLASPGQPFATTAASGPTASASGYTGSYSICADYKPGNTYFKSTAPSVTNTNFQSVTPVPIAITNQSQQGQC
jgi:Tfp pilus assembly protein PilV